MGKSKKLGLSQAKLDRMVEEAIVDCHDEDEQFEGFVVMIEDNLEVPFEMMVLGIKVRVTKIDGRGRDITAICERDGHRQAIPILELPLPSPKPKGSDWIEAYRHWLGEV